MRVIDTISENACAYPHKEAVCLPLADPPVSWSYGELLFLTRKVAGGLAEAGLKPGNRIMIVLNRLEEAIPTLLGCMYSGITASILPTPGLLQDGRSRNRELIRKARELDFHALITAETDAGREFPVLNAETLLSSVPTSAPAVEPAAGVPAYIQFSSGTSGSRKGVMLSHAAIHNMFRDFPIEPSSISDQTTASWLPLFHDFGLFAGVLLPLCFGYRALLCSPVQWLRKPGRFLRLLEEYSASLLFITPSGLVHSLRSLDEPDRDIKLTKMTAIFLGGEPLCPASLDFIQKGLRGLHCPDNVLRNGYGMAENTLYATITPPGRPIRIDRGPRRTTQKAGVPPGSSGAVSIGTPHGSNRVRICDDHDRPLKQRRIGEIQICSCTLFSGYHKRPDLSPVLSADGWYRTGDCGYMAEGECFFTGRKRDLIIVGGQNIAPEDIEALTYDIEGIFPERSAAFGIQDPALGTEKIVLVVEGRRGLSEERKTAISRQLARMIYRETGLAPATVQVMPRGWVCRTRNGKISRARTREKFLSFLGK